MKVQDHIEYDDFGEYWENEQLEPVGPVKRQNPPFSGKVIYDILHYLSARASMTRASVSRALS